MTNDLVTRAAAFAKMAHESIDQRRKFTNEPYIVHPQAVAELVASVTDDPTTIAAAWLHDVVEDTPVTIEEIESAFGLEVAKLVSDLTDVSKLSDGNRKVRIAIDRQHSAAADARAKTVKLADVIDNLSDITQQNRGFARKYLPEKEQLIEVLKDGNPQLLKMAQEVVKQTKQLLEQ